MCRNRSHPVHIRHWSNTRVELQDESTWQSGKEQREPEITSLGCLFLFNCHSDPGNAGENLADRTLPSLSTIPASEHPRLVKRSSGDWQ